MTTPTMGHECTFSVGGTSVHGWCTLAKRGTHLERDGMRGTRSHDVDDVVDGPYTVSGQIILNPTNTELVLLDVKAIGASGVVTETVPEFAVIVDKGQAVYTYGNCKVDRFTLRGRQGELLELVCDVSGKTETVAGSAPAEPASALPFWFDGVTLILQSSAREVEEFELVIDNALVKDRFQNSQTVTDLLEGDRNVTLRTVHGYSSNTSGLYGQAIAGATGTLAVSDGTSTRTYTFGKLQVPADGVEIRDKGEQRLTLNMVARKDGATKEIAAA